MGHAYFWLLQNLLKLFVILLCCLWQLKGFEVIKAVHLDPEPFDMERDLITPTYKKKRPQLLKYYKVPLILFPLGIFLNTCINNVRNVKGAVNTLVPLW